MIVLGEAVGSTHHIEAIFGCAVLVLVRFERLGHRIIVLLGMEEVFHRAFHGLVVLREGTIGHSRQRDKETAGAFGRHDEWPHVIFRMGVYFEVRHIVAYPPLLGIVPLDLGAVGIPGLAVQIAGSAVVEDAAVRRP